jgi:hypothetical protein
MRIRACVAAPGIAEEFFAPWEAAEREGVAVVW